MSADKSQNSAERRGRPAGAKKPLLQDDDRFTIAFYIYRVSQADAAEMPPKKILQAQFAVSLFEGQAVPLPARDGMIGAELSLHNSPAQPENRWKHIKRKGDAALSAQGLETEERIWLIDSANALLRALNGQDHAIRGLALNDLVRLGWPAWTFNALAMQGGKPRV